MKGISIRGTGSYLPNNSVPNREFERLLDTSDEWIRERTGIESRCLATGESNFDMLRAAVERAMQNAGAAPEEIAAVVIATVTGDYLTPSMSCRLQRALKLPEEILVFDLNAACCGFLYALNIASLLLRDNPGKLAIVAGSEMMSRMVDFSDRSTAVLFGDGAGAAVVGGSDGAFDFYSGAKGGDEHLSCLASYGGENPFSGSAVERPFRREYFRMNGREVFRFAVESIITSIKKVTAKVAGDVYILHQANKRIIQSAAKRLSVPEERFFLNVMTRGNTSAASIPIAMDELNRAGGLRRGDSVVLAGFGGGLTYGAARFNW